MLKKDLMKHSPIRVNQEITHFDDLKITNVLIQQYLKITYQAILTYRHETDEIEVEGLINYQILALDARDGTTFEHDDQIDWNETYLFSDFNDETLDLNQLVTEQINANTPINLTHNRGTINNVGPGWQLLSEEEFELSRSQASDPRWAKLKEYNQKDK